MNTNENLTAIRVRDLEVGMILGGVSEIVGFPEDEWDRSIYGSQQRGILVRYVDFQGNATIMAQYLPSNLVTLVA